MDSIALPECIVCLQLYDDGEHTPHVLSCGHSLCVSCAVELPSQWGESSSAGSLSGGTKPPGSVIRCPECNQRTKLPFGGPAGLPKNIELMRLLAGLQRWADTQVLKGKEGKAAPAPLVVAQVQQETASVEIAKSAKGARFDPLENGNGSYFFGEHNLNFCKKVGKGGAQEGHKPRGLAPFLRSKVDRQHRLGGVVSKLGGIRGLGAVDVPPSGGDGELELDNGRDEEMCDVHNGSQEDDEDDAEALAEASGWPCLVEVNVLEGHFDTVTAVTIYGNYLLSTSFDKLVRVWSLQDGTLVKTFEGHGHRVMALAVDHDSKVCFSGDYGGQIFVWNLSLLSASKPLVTWQEHNDWRYTGVACLLPSNDGVLYSGSGDRTIKAWSMQDYSLLSTMEGHKGLVSTLFIDGEVLYSGSWDGTVRLWWRVDHSSLASIGGSDFGTLGCVRSLAASGGLIFVARDNGSIQVWRDEEYLGLIDAHTGAVSSLCVGGNWLYTGSLDKSLKAWQIQPSLLDSRPELVSIGTSAVTSLVAHNGRLYGGFAEGSIKVFREIQHPRELQNDGEIFHCSA